MVIGAIVGAFLGLALVNVMALIARNSGNPCDAVSFASTDGWNLKSNSSSVLMAGKWAIWMPMATRFFNDSGTATYSRISVRATSCG